MFLNYAKEDKALCMFALYERMLDDNADGNVDNLIKDIEAGGSKAKDVLLAFFTNVRDALSLVEKSKRLRDERNAIEDSLLKIVDYRTRSELLMAESRKKRKKA